MECPALCIQGLARGVRFSFDAAAMKTSRLALPLCLALGALGIACDSDDKKAGAKDTAAKGKDGKAAKGDEGGKDAPKPGADAKPEPAKPVKLAKVSLEDSGLDATLQAPEGAKVAEEFGAYTVKAGESFQLEIHASAADLAARKKEITDNTVNKLKKFVTESETALVYETEVMGKGEFHFVSNKELDGAKYYCEDTKGRAFTQAEIEAMVAACDSLTAT